MYVRVASLPFAVGPALDISVWKAPNCHVALDLREDAGLACLAAAFPDC